MTGRLINDLIFDEKLGSVSTPLMKVLNSSLMKKTKSSIVKKLLTKATQEYIDFADLDGNTAASMAIKDQKSDLAKMIIEKTSVSFLFAINARGESAISLACRREENDLIEMIIEKYNNDLLEEEQKSIWNNNNYYYILVSLIGLIEEDNACFQKLEKAINNLFVWFSETPPMKEEFLSETKYNHAYNNFIQNKNDFWHLIRDWSNQQEQNEESLNYASHLDQIH